MEDVTTVLAACLATAVAATGMWKFFGDVLDLPIPLRVALFAFVEVAMVTSALRARRNVRESASHSAGADGIAVWVFTALSAVLSASDADGVRQALIRLAAPLVAAWLWERGLAADRRRATGRAGRIHWRLTPERLLVRLGVAEPTGRTASDVDGHRRLARLAKAAKKVRILRAAGAKPRTLARALARLDKAMDAAVEHAHLATDPTRQQTLLAQISLLYHASDLADLNLDAPWQPAPAPSASTAALLPPADRPRSEELVALGFESAKVQTYLADRFGLQLAEGDITRAMAHTPGAAPAAALHARLGIAPPRQADPDDSAAQTTPDPVTPPVPVSDQLPKQATDPVPDLVAGRAANQVHDRPGDQGPARDRTQVPPPSDGQVPDPATSSSSDPDINAVPAPDADLASDRSADTNHPADTALGKEVPEPSKPRRTRKRKRARTSPHERLEEARTIDAQYRAEHGRPIPAEKLARAMRIGKPAALDLVQKIRSKHITAA
ncbi:hypothetical protein [Actinomadura kijaniata]|uniref:hypothetical protein n=1 Tax=Actinomadura kijaniata TaxID=46161 RepID=UPI000831E2CD|nr:hypothetical protein [Actinomadura kijaniata]